MTANEQLELDGLHLWKSLIKDGCEWHGDCMSQKWSEVLEIPDGLLDQVHLTCSPYEEGKHYRFSDSNTMIWVY